MLRFDAPFAHILRRLRPRGEPLTPQDAGWLRMEHRENLMSILVVMLLDAPIDVQAVREVVIERLLLHEKFRKRVVERKLPGLRPRWVDAEVDLGAHVRPLPLAPPGGQAALEAAVSALMSRPLDRRRPLWDVHVVERFAGGAALIARVHHAVGDGTALVRVLLSLSDGPEDDPAAEARKRAAGLRVPGLLERLRLAVPAGRALGRLLTLPKDPRSSVKGPLGVEKRAAWSAPIALDRIKWIARAFDATFNDVVMAAAAGTLRHYLWLRGDKPMPLMLHAVVPVDLRDRTRAGELRNVFGLVFAALPVGLAGPATRLAEVERTMASLKESPEAAVVFDLLGAAARTRPELEHRIVRWFAGKASTVVTNVRGPSAARRLAGRPLGGLMVWAPQSGEIGLGLSVLSYAGQVRLGVSADAGLVPDPHRIAAGFVDELVALEHHALRAAGRAEPMPAPWAP